MAPEEQVQAVRPRIGKEQRHDGAQQVLVVVRLLRLGQVDQELAAGGNAGC